MSIYSPGDSTIAGESGTNPSWINQAISTFLDSSYSETTINFGLWDLAKTAGIPDSLESKILLVGQLYKRSLLSSGALSAMMNLTIGVVACTTTHIVDGDLRTINQRQRDDLIDGFPVSEKGRQEIILFFKAIHTVSQLLLSDEASNTDRCERFLALLEQELESFTPEQESLFAELIAHYLFIMETSSSVNTPELCMMLLQTSSPRILAFLHKVPFLWKKEDFYKLTQPGPDERHRRISGKSIRINSTKINKLKKGIRKAGGIEGLNNNLASIQMDAQARSQVSEFAGLFHFEDLYCYLQCLPNPHIVVIADSLGIGTHVALVHSQFDKKSILSMMNQFRNTGYEELNREAMQQSLFPNLISLKPIEWDEQKLSTLEGLVDNPVSDRVDSVSTDAITLTDTDFLTPGDHHRDILNQLECEVVEESLDIGQAPGETAPRYIDSHHGIEVRYSQKLRLIISHLGDRLVKNDDGKVKVYVFAASPYVLIEVTSGGSIILSDLDGVGTQVFAKTIDHDFLTKDFSFRDLSDMFGPWTTVKQAIGELDDPCEDNYGISWATRINISLTKEGSYFLELQGNESVNVGGILRNLFATGTLGVSDMLTPKKFILWLDAYNAGLKDDPSKTAFDKKQRALINNKGASIEIAQAIRALGGHGHHGYARVFGEYMIKLLESDIDGATQIIRKLQSSHVVSSSVSGFIQKLETGETKLSSEDFTLLFSTKKERQNLIKRLSIPFGLYTCVSWIIALGVDPDDTKPGQTLEGFLREILIKKNILPV